MGVVVRRYIDILTIIINFPYSTCISSFVSSSIPTSLFIFKMCFRSLYIEWCTYFKGQNKYSSLDSIKLGMLFMATYMALNFSDHNL